MAPLAPVITRFTERAVISGDTITLERNGRRCVFRIGSDTFMCDGVTGVSPVAPFGRGGVAYVPLAEVVHAFGGAVEYDARTHIVALAVVQDATLRTPAPFNPSAPSVTPTTVFTRVTRRRRPRRRALSRAAVRCRGARRFQRSLHACRRIKVPRW